MKKKLVVYWSRRDFRLLDNPALFRAVTHAKDEGSEFLPLFILEDYMVKASPTFQFGYPSRVFLSKALPRYTQQFDHFLLIQGKVLTTFKAFHESYTLTIYVNDDIYPDFYSQIRKLREAGIDVHVCEDNLSIPKETKTQSGSVYSVFTPFKHAVWEQFVTNHPLLTAKLDSLSYARIASETIQKLTRIDSTEEAIMKQFRTERSITIGTDVYNIDDYISYKPDLSSWYVDEREALARFTHFLTNDIHTYKARRDYVSLDGTSRMSLALTWGLVSARTLVKEMKTWLEHDFIRSGSAAHQSAEHYLSELIWREFYAYLFFHNPSLMDTEFQAKHRKNIPWVQGDEEKTRFTAWIKGKTGYSLVDAAMMQLAKSGYMHNRSRMVVSSILTKNLGVDWRLGQEYFRAMLVDLDERSNNGGWQWGASVGADPKPIRIFNPYTQAKNYDADASYQKEWLGESTYALYAKEDPTSRAHGQLFSSPETIFPIVPHREARGEALKRYGLEGKVLPRDY